MRISDWSSDVCSSDLVPSLFDLPSRLGPPREGEDLGAWYVRLAGEMTADDWKRYAETLNKTAAALKPHGLRIAHHNHNLEFNPVGDTTGFNLIVEHTDPALVAFEIDTGRSEEHTSELQSLMRLSYAVFC